MTSPCRLTASAPLVLMLFLSVATLACEDIDIPTNVNARSWVCEGTVSFVADHIPYSTMDVYPFEICGNETLSSEDKKLIVKTCKLLLNKYYSGEGVYSSVKVEDGMIKPNGKETIVFFGCDAPYVCDNGSHTLNDIDAEWDPFAERQ